MSKALHELVDGFAGATFSPDILWHRDAKRLGEIIRKQYEYSFKDTPWKFPCALQALFREHTGDLPLRFFWVNLLSSYIACRRGVLRHLHRKSTVLAIARCANKFYKCGPSFETLCSKATGLRLHAVDKADDPFAQTFTSMVDHLRRLYSGNFALALLIIQMVCATRSFLILHHFIESENAVETVSSLYTELAALTTAKSQKLLQGTLAQFNDGRMQFSTRPDVPWKFYTTNQKMCPGNVLHAVLAPWLLSTTGIEDFFVEGDCSQLLLRADAVNRWPRIGDLEFSHTLEFLEEARIVDGFDDAMAVVTGGSNGKSYLQLEKATSQKQGSCKSRTWVAVTEDINCILAAALKDGKHREVTAAVAESAACKMLQVASSFAMSNTFGRAHTTNYKLELSGRGEKLLKLCPELRGRGKSLKKRPAVSVEHGKATPRKKR